LPWGNSPTRSEIQEETNAVLKKLLKEGHVMNFKKKLFLQENKLEVAKKKVIKNKACKWEMLSTHTSCMFLCYKWIEGGKLPKN